MLTVDGLWVIRSTGGLMQEHFLTLAVNAWVFRRAGEGFSCRLVSLETGAIWELNTSLTDAELEGVVRALFEAISKATSVARDAEFVRACLVDSEKWRTPQQQTTGKRPPPPSPSPPSPPLPPAFLTPPSVVVRPPRIRAPPRPSPPPPPQAE